MSVYQPDGRRRGRHTWVPSRLHGVVSAATSDSNRLLLDRVEQLIGADADTPAGRFQQVVAAVLEQRGYGALVPRGHVYAPDKGIDIECRDAHENKVGVQCKRYGRNISRHFLSEFEGDLNYGGFNRGIFVTTREFTRNARDFEGGRFPIEFVDGHKLTGWLKDYEAERGPPMDQASGVLTNMPRTVVSHGRLLVGGGCRRVFGEFVRMGYTARG